MRYSPGFKYVHVTLPDKIIKSKGKMGLVHNPREK